MKKILVGFVFLWGLTLSLSCSTSNTSAPKPFTESALSATPTPLPVSSGGGPTPTFSIPVPVYQNDYGTVAVPNGIVINGVNLTVAEFENKGKGPIPYVEGFTITGAGTVQTLPYQANSPNVGDFIYQGIPTPLSTPPWVPSTVNLNGPQGFVNPGGFGGYSAILDNQANGGATLYYGNSGMLAWGGSAPLGVGAYGVFYEPYSTNGYGGVTFKTPKAMTADNTGYEYIADTGNGYVEQFVGVVPLHYWTGNAGVVFANPSGAFTSVVFRSPSAVGCDTANPANIWEGDTGFSPSVIESFSSGGTTITNAWAGLPGCVVTGIAVNPTTHNIYVADSGNALVEIYSTTGSLLADFGDPHGAHENLPFAPSAIAFDSTNNVVWVGDSNNDLIIAFK